MRKKLLGILSLLIITVPFFSGCAIRDEVDSDFLKAIIDFIYPNENNDDTSTEETTTIDGGWGSTDIIEPKDVTNYLQWTLDNIYLGEFNEEYLALFDATSDDAYKRYLEGIRYEVDIFMEMYELEDTQETRDRLIDFYIELYLSSRYTVSTATPMGVDEYSISVTIEPIMLISDVNDGLNEMFSSMIVQKLDKPTPEETNEGLAELKEDYDEIVLLFFENTLYSTAVTHGEPIVVDVRIDFDNEHSSYIINSDDFVAINETIIEYPNMDDVGKPDILTKEYNNDINIDIFENTTNDFSSEANDDDAIILEDATIATNFVKWTLDNNYRGIFSDEYLDYFEIDEAEAKESYLRSVGYEVDYFTRKFDLETDNPYGKRLLDFYVELYSHSKYTVHPATQISDNRYNVKVTIEPVLLIREFTEELGEKIGAYMDNSSDLSGSRSNERYETYDRIIIEFFEEKLKTATITYGEAVDIDVIIDIGFNFYDIDSFSLSAVDTKIISYPSFDTNYSTPDLDIV